VKRWSSKGGLEEDPPNDNNRYLANDDILVRSARK